MSPSYLSRFLLPLAGFVLMTCSKAPEDQPTPTGPTTPAVTLRDEDLLPSEAVVTLDGLPSEKISIDKIMVLPGVSVKSFLEEYEPSFLGKFPASKGIPGVAEATIADESPYIKKAWLNARMLAIGANYVDDSKRPYLKGLGDNEPAHDGIAYVFGSRSITTRTSAEQWRLTQPVATRPSGPWCPEKLYGLDCSGFTSLMLENAGLRGMSAYNASQQFDVDNWNTAITNAPEKLSGLRAVKYSATEKPPGTIEAGDVVFWRSRGGNISHMGIALKDTLAGTVTLFQSNGDWEATAAKPCSENYSDNRGPRIITISDINNKLKPLTYAGIIRLEFPITCVTAVKDVPEVKRLMKGGPTGKWKRVSWGDPATPNSGPIDPNDCLSKVIIQWRPDGTFIATSYSKDCKAITANRNNFCATKDRIGLGANITKVDSNSPVLFTYWFYNDLLVLGNTSNSQGIVTTSIYAYAPI